MSEDKLALRPEARSAVCVAAPRVDARPGALQGSPSPTNALCPRFQPKARHSSGVRRAVEGEELIPVPHVGKNSPLGVKLQSLME